MASRGFIGGGDLYIARAVNGVFGDYVGPYECTKFEIKPNVDRKEMTSRGKSTYGQVIETVSLQKPAELKIELAEVNKESLTVALLGVAGTLSQVAGTLVSELLTPRLGVWLAVSKSALIAPVVVKNSAGTTIFVDGIDYLVNRELGWIKPLVGGAITLADVLKVSCSYSAVTGSEIRGAVTADIRAKFKLDGKNLADGLPVILTVHEAVISPDSAFDFLQADFASVSLPGRMKTPTGMLEPFTVHLRDAAVS